MASLLSIFLFLTFACSFSSSSVESYRKELRTKKELNQEAVIQLGHSIKSNRIDPSRVSQLSWRPRIFLYRGFLSDEECAHLISLAHGKIESSLGKGGDSGKVVTNTLLTGSVMPLDIDQAPLPWSFLHFCCERVLRGPGDEESIEQEDAIAARIEDRISAWTFLPKENGKSLQILHYGLEETKQHNNTFGDKSRVAFGELLVATIVLYLSNVTRGGEVVFPKSEFKKTQPRDDTLSDCAKTSYALRPMKGNALLFFSHHLNMTPDESSLHARCPVLEGEMWCATKFFHVREIDRREVSLESKSSECTDEDENCPRWATLGECQRNPVYMIGSPDYYGSCRKSCNAC